jgi:hypothetical protein
MDVAEVSPLLLGWSVAGFGVVAWFVWRRRRLGPMTRGVVIGYSGLLGLAAAVIVDVTTAALVGAAAVGIVVGIIAYLILNRS